MTRKIFSETGFASLQRPLHFQFQMAFCPEHCFSFRKRLGIRVRLPFGVSGNELNRPARLAPRSCIFLISAGFVAPLLGMPSRAGSRFNDSGSFRDCGYCSCVVTQICFSKNSGAVLFNSTVGRCHFALCLCFFTSLVQVLSALFLLSDFSSYTPKPLSFSFPHLSLRYPTSNEQLLRVSFWTRARQDLCTAQPYP